MIRIYYHNADLDGLCSAAIAYRHYGDNADYRGVDYGDPVDLDPTLERILFLDFHLEPPVPANVFLLDHHKTSIGLPGIIDTERAACEIAWDYFYGGKRPAAVDWIGAADNYRKVSNWDHEVVPFCLALQTEWPDIKSQTWFYLLHKDCQPDQYVEDGRAMLRFSRAENARLCQQQAYSTYFRGWPAVVIIGGQSGSHRFDAHQGSELLRIVVQYRADRRWYYSLRSSEDGPDVSEIAKHFGGGGHQHAAGFSREELLV